MPERKSYGQFCGLARALDRIGDRWTLLVIRELLLGPISFRRLQEGLSGVSPALLTQRVNCLIADGLVERNDAPARSKSVEYALTAAGHDLEDAIFELIRWGGRWMLSGPGDDRVDPAWALLALRALLAGEPARQSGTAHLGISHSWLTIDVDGGRRRVAPGRQGAADVTIELELPDALAVAFGASGLRDTQARITGSKRLAAALLEPTQMSGERRRATRSPARP
jgi:DNA-binding HxlR family transcriptional regulator